MQLGNEKSSDVTHKSSTLKQLAAALPSAASPADEVSFEFRKQQFIYSVELQKFQKLPYPCKETFGHYGKCTGYGSDAKAQAAATKWGRNVYVKFMLSCFKPYLRFASNYFHRDGVLFTLW